MSHSNNSNSQTLEAALPLSANPGTGRESQIIGDLNREYKENELAHYVNVSQMDEVILGVRESTRALCGEVFNREHEDFGGVDSYHLGKKKRLLCPVCHVLYSRLGA